MHFSVSSKLLTMGKGATTFQQKWCSLYGLKVTAREASSGRVNTVECRFCQSFGKGTLARTQSGAGPRASKYSQSRGGPTT
jgi:hypothetical protein